MDGNNEPLPDFLRDPTEYSQKEKVPWSIIMGSEVKIATTETPIGIELCKKLQGNLIAK